MRIFNKFLSLFLSLIILIGIIPYDVLANDEVPIVEQSTGYNEDVAKMLKEYLNNNRYLLESGSSNNSYDPGISYDAGPTSDDSSIMPIAVFANADIELDYFEFFCVDGAKTFDTSGITSIKGGRIDDTAPQVVNTIDDGIPHKHTYKQAMIGDIPISHVGKVEVEGYVYVYYILDGNSDDITSYPVLILGPNKKIKLFYTHANDLDVTYQFEHDGIISDVGPNGTSIDDIFGSDKFLNIASGSNVPVNINIPRGYTATIKVTTTEGGYELYNQTIGHMPTYSKDGNNIILAEGSVEKLDLTHIGVVSKVTNDITFTLSYEPIENYSFNIWLWYQTVFARERIQRIYLGSGWREVFINGNPYTNSISTMPFTTEHGFAFVTNVKDGPWDMNQLEINGEKINVPNIVIEEDPELHSNDYVWEETTLSSGTIIKLGVKSVNLNLCRKCGATNSGWQRLYEIKVENCFENLTVTGGNMTGIGHREIVMDTSVGVGEPQVYSGWDETTGVTVDPRDWVNVKPEVLINRRQYYHYSDPIRFKRAFGYEFVNEINLTSKTGQLLQHNDEIHYGTSDLIEYLKLKEDAELFENGNPKPLGEVSGSNKKMKIYDDRTFEVIPFEQWKYEVSKDGYYYFRTTRAFEDAQLEAETSKNSMILTLSAPLVKGGLDYQSGAGRINDLGEKISPNEEDIINMPEYQNGGEEGYNILTNQDALISSKIPYDNTGEFIFKEWVLMATLTDKDNPYGLLLDETYKENGKEFHFKPSQHMHIINDFLKGSVANALYFNYKEKRGTGTLRAVWEKAEKEDIGVGATIPYILHTYLEQTDEFGNVGYKLIDENIHQVDGGATIMVDLYDEIDGEITVSHNIQNILKGNNDEGIVYKGPWVIDHDRSSKRIDNVSINNNIASIYVRNKTLDIEVEKQWFSNDKTQIYPSVTIMAQRKENDIWIDCPETKTTLTKEDLWETTIAVTKYENSNGKITTITPYTYEDYRIVELDVNDVTLEENDKIIINGLDFIVRYTNENNSSWKVLNSQSYKLTYLDPDNTPDFSQLFACNELTTPPIEPTKEGFYFGGWYTSSDGGLTLDDKYEFGQLLTEDVTLYAEWLQLTLPNSGGEGTRKGNIMGIILIGLGFCMFLPTIYNKKKSIFF